MLDNTNTSIIHRCIVSSKLLIVDENARIRMHVHNSFYKYVNVSACVRACVHGRKEIFEGF